MTAVYTQSQMMSKINIYNQESKIISTGHDTLLKVRSARYAMAVLLLYILYLCHTY